MTPDARRTFVPLLCAAALAVVAPLSAVAQDRLPGAPPVTPQRKPQDIRFVVVHRPGPAWQAGKSPFEQPGIQAHIEHYRQLLQQGKLALGGPFLGAVGGGMMIPEGGVGEQEIAEFAAADPAVKSGLLTFEIRPWLIGMRRP